MKEPKQEQKGSNLLESLDSTNDKLYDDVVIIAGSS